MNLGDKSHKTQQTLEDETMCIDLMRILLMVATSGIKSSSVLNIKACRS